MYKRLKGRAEARPFLFYEQGTNVLRRRRWRGAPEVDCICNSINIYVICLLFLCAVLPPFLVLLRPTGAHTVGITLNLIRPHKLDKDFIRAKHIP